MTCDEFREIRTKSPFDCTRTERLASHKHRLMCDGCHKWSLSLLGPLTDEQRLTLAIAAPIVKRLSQKDKAAAKDDKEAT
jgi:hypothetical protein